MSGAFGNFFNYSKPGKGVTKDEVRREREKVTFSGFFKIYRRKFWQLIQLNMLSFIFFLPMVLIFVFFVSQYIIAPKQLPLYSDGMNDQAYIALWNAVNTTTNKLVQNSMGLVDIFSRAYIGVFFTAIPLIALGPIQAGFTYIMQSFIRERPVFLTTDFFSKAKKNFLHSMIVCIVDLIMTALFIFGMHFYGIQAANNASNVLWTVGLVVMGILLLVYMLMHIYIYPLMVTFNVNLRQLYKNSFFLAMTSFFPGIFILLIDAAVIYIIASVIATPMYVILLGATLVYSTIGLINNYFGFKYIKYHLLDPALEAAEKKSIENGEKIFSDETRQN